MKSGGLRVILALAVLTTGFGPDSARAEALKIAGSSVVNPVIAEAVPILQQENGLEIQLATRGGSTGGIAALGAGEAAIALTARELTAEDRAQFPDVNLNPIYFGEQVVTLGVARDVWEGGVRAMTRAQALGIYEGKIKNWHEVGGPDEKIAFFNFEEGHGVWEIFAQWLYVDAKQAPLGKFTALTGNDDARNTLEFTSGAMTPISPLALDSHRSFALAIKGDDGTLLEPSAENVAAKKFPLTHPLYLVVNDRPTEQVKVFVDFMLGPRGQELMKKHAFFSAAVLKAAAAK